MNKQFNLGGSESGSSDWISPFLQKSGSDLSWNIEPGSFQNTDSVPIIRIRVQPKRPDPQSCIKLPKNELILPLGGTGIRQETQEGHADQELPALQCLSCRSVGIRFYRCCKHFISDLKKTPVFSYDIPKNDLLLNKCWKY